MSRPFHLQKFSLSRLPPVVRLRRSHSSALGPRIVSPVMRDAARDARNTTMPATSIGSPIRCSSGMRSITSERNSRSARQFSVPGARIKRGEVEMKEQLKSVVLQMYRAGVRCSEAVWEFQKAFILTVLKHQRGNQCKAAERLGMEYAASHDPRAGD
jgi:Bacterial regulatory protein, Fis family